MIYTDTLVGIALPHINVPEIMAVKWKRPMEAFSNWWIVGLNGLLIAKNRSMDPFQHWMNENGGSSLPRQRSKSQNVPLTQRREIGRKDSV